MTHTRHISSIRSDGETLQCNFRKNSICAAALFSVLFVLSTASVYANHTVLVEGEADFDGDGKLGVAEDGDGDQVFGTINAAVSGVSDNGRVMIVTSGRFFEQVVLKGNGVTVLEAAPGVDAIIEAFNGGGDLDANNTRQMQPGIVVDTDGSFPIEIRNVVSRNWTEGIQIRGMSQVTIDDVKVDSNVDYGIHVLDSAKVVITDSQVNSSGFRRSGTLGATPGDNTPDPGIGIAFDNRSSGIVTYTTVAHSFGAGISANMRSVKVRNNTVFNNNPDYGNRGKRGKRTQKQ